MKIAVVNGLLKNEEEMKRILELVVHEFDRYDIMFNYINLSEEKLDSYQGLANPKMDEIFNKILTSDAIIVATSIHMGNITHLMQNFFNYFEINKYKVALTNKIALPVVIHNSSDEVLAYSMMLNVFKRFNVNEVNKLFLNIPDTIDDQYLDKACKYIKNRTKEFASILAPKKVEERSVDNSKINEILTSNELVYDENQLTLDLDNTAENDIKELTGMVNDKLKAKEIINNDINNKNVNEITQKYKTKIEEIMQETLFGDDDNDNDDDGNETVAERILKNAQEEASINNNIQREKSNSVTEINSKFGSHVSKDALKKVESVKHDKIERRDDESLDSLIARVVARTKERDEEEKRIAQEKKEDAKKVIEKNMSNMNVNNGIQENDVIDKVNESNNLRDNIHEEAEETKDNAREKLLNSLLRKQQDSSNDFNGEEFVKVIRHNDEELVNEAIEINKINEANDFDKYDINETYNIDSNIDDSYDNANGEIYGDDNSASASSINSSNSDSQVDRFEPESIKLLRERLNGLKREKEELASNVNEFKNEMNDAENVVTINKFELESFNEPHEIIAYDEDNESAQMIDDSEKSKQHKMTLKEMTKNLIYLFKAPSDETMKALVQINVEGTEGFSLYLNIIDNKCAVFDGVNMNNDLTIYVKDDKWRTILDGEVTLQRAFMTGLVKVTGNFMMLNKLDNTLLAYNK